MSPLSLRRYRAERLLAREFEALRGRVMAAARGRLVASGISLDRGDLEACYAQAWQGLYAAMLEGREVANPAGWLVLVTFRRAVDEHRSRTYPCAGLERVACEPDLAGAVDDRTRLHQLFEGMCSRLDPREREAAALCYLQGLSRAQAAARLGVSEARMRKLMDGRGPARPGVAGKVGELVATIRDGGWCEEQGSLMRALAYGMLEPGGERHRLALAHSDDCPSCRAYVASLRGLAAVLPPVLLPSSLAAGVLAQVLDGTHAGASAAAGGASLARAGTQAQRGLGGALPASGAAGGTGAAAGGGWLLGGGSLAGKLTVGCLITLSLGAGCVALDHRAPRSQHPPRGVSPAHTPAANAGLRQAAADQTAPQLRVASAPPPSPAVAPGPQGRALREFGPERSPAAVRRPRAPSGQATAARSVSGSPALPVLAVGAAAAPPTHAAAPAGDAASAAREFTPG